MTWVRDIVPEGITDVRTRSPIEACIEDRTYTNLAGTKAPLSR